MEVEVQETHIPLIMSSSSQLKILSVGVFVRKKYFGQTEGWNRAQIYRSPELVVYIVLQYHYSYTQHLYNSYKSYPTRYYIHAEEASAM